MKKLQDPRLTVPGIEMTRSQQCHRPGPGLFHMTSEPAPSFILCCVVCLPRLIRFLWHICQISPLEVYQAVIKLNDGSGFSQTA